MDVEGEEFAFPLISMFQSKVRGEGISWNIDSAWGKLFGSAAHSRSRRLRDLVRLWWPVLMRPASVEFVDIVHCSKASSVKSPFP